MPRLKKTTESMSSYIRVTDFQIYSENPFADELVQEMTVKQKRKYLRSEDGKAAMIVVQPETGELTAQAQFYEIEEVDDAQFVKIFANFFAIQTGLSKTGRDVLSYIMTLLRPKQDTVTIRVDQALLFLGTKHRKTYLTGIGNLLDKGVIARTRYDDEFFINPSIMFNGDRVSYAKMYVRKKTKNANINDPNQMTFDFKPKTLASAQRQHEKLLKNEQQLEEDNEPE